MQKWKLVLFLIVGLTKVRKVQVTLESIHEQVEYVLKLYLQKREPSIVLQIYLSNLVHGLSICDC